MPAYVFKFKVSVCIIVVKDGTEFYASCPTLKGVHVPGDTKKDAINNCKDAIIAYIFSLLKHNEPIPCYGIIDEDMLPDGVSTKDFKKYLHHENIEINYPVGDQEAYRNTHPFYH